MRANHPDTNNDPPTTAKTSRCPIRSMFATMPDCKAGSVVIMSGAEIPTLIEIAKIIIPAPPRINAIANRFILRPRVEGWMLGLRLAFVQFVQFKPVHHGERRDQRIPVIGLGLGLVLWPQIGQGSSQARLAFNRQPGTPPSDHTGLFVCALATRPDC